MPRYHYLIVGGGMAADAAVAGIRAVDPEGWIGLISAELSPPYNRPPLSKGLWKGKSLETIWRHAAVREAALHLGRSVTAIDPAAHQVTDDEGAVYGYGKLLLATGGSPRRLSGEPDPVIYFRTLDDYHNLRSWTEQRRRFVVIGGGFIGAEIAAALATAGKQVLMVFPEEGLGGRMFPAELARFLNDFYRQRGVEVRAAEEVLAVAIRDDTLAVQTREVASHRPQEIVTDGVVAGLGIEPNLELARRAGLAIGTGIRVDSALRTDQPDIYAAGDVAEFFSPALGRYLRVEHEDNALTMGEMAGRSMAGQTVAYEHLPSFYSDLFELGYEAVGETDSRLETVADWQIPYREGVVFYLREGRVRGVLLWNVWERVDAARRLIAAADSFRPEELKRSLLEGYKPAQETHG